jgi:hypothetical protein
MANLPDGRFKLDVSGNLTIVADTHSGLVLNVTADAKTLTLPALVVGAQYTVRNSGVPGSAGNAPVGSGGGKSILVTIAPNGTDTIGGNGRASANTNLLNTKATSRAGDEVTLQGRTGGWQIINQRGIWA